MAPNITFFAGLNGINNLSGSGLGFYGAGGFGQSVAVGQWQGRTFITDSAGAQQGAEANNISYLNAASGVIGQAGSGVALTAIPNYQATLNVRFTNDTPVKAQNAQFWAYDRVNINNPPSGVVTKAAELIHPGAVQTNTGSGSPTWATPAGSGAILYLSQSPGTSGNYASPTSLYVDTQHDWYLAISQSPTVVGSRLSAAYFYLEYL